MADQPGVFWLNGALLAGDASCIDPSDRGLLLGDGLFETIAVRRGQARDVQRHFARLQQGCALLRLRLPWDLAAVERALDEVAVGNGLLEGGLRLTLTRGPAPRGLLPTAAARPTLMITGFCLSPVASPVRVIVSTQIRRDAASPLSRIKSLNYLPNILARLEAEDAKVDDAILLNQAGFVAEATTGNIFLKRRGKWLTPFVSDGALPGICREKFLESGQVEEARIHAAWLSSAEAFCIGNVLSVRAVSQIGPIAVPTTDYLRTGPG